MYYPLVDQMFSYVAPLLDLAGISMSFLRRSLLRFVSRIC